MSTDALAAALDYAGHGLPVFPCKPRSKAPATEHGYKDATTDGGLLHRRLIAAGPDCNLAIATGGWGFVLDFDGPNAGVWLAAMEASHGTLPETWTVKTRRGEHRYFRSSASVPTSTGKLAADVDIKAAGGYVLAPPSVHPGGESYGWLVGPAQQEMAEAPAWLVDLITAHRAGTGAPKTTAQESYRPDPSSPVDDFNARATWAEILEPHGWVLGQVAGDGNQHVQRPGKELNGEPFATSATISENGSGLLYIFTSSTELGAGKAYSRFAAYALLNHSGDFKAAAAELSRQGYGAPRGEIRHGNRAAPEPWEPPAAEETAAPPADTGPRPTLDEDARPATGWEAADLRPYLTGTRAPRPAATMLQRADGINLLYDRKLHWISGEPEGLKSWLVQIAVADTIMLGRVAIYVDFEADRDSVLGRLLELGCTPEALLDRLSYHRPEVGVGRNGTATAELLLATAKARRPAISVIDGVQASMGLDDLDSNSARDFYRWWGLFGRQLLKLTSGPTVAVDHVVKLSENRRQYAAGTGQKQAAVDVHLGTELLEPFGVGLTGRAALTLQKDRPGMLQQYAGKRVEGRAPLGVLTMQSFGESSGIRFAIEPPDGTSAGGFRPTVYMERVSRYVELTGASGAAQSRTAIEKGAGGKHEYARKAIDVLVSEGYLRMVPGRVVAGSQTATYISVREYREATDHYRDARPGVVLRSAGEVVI